MPTTVHTVNTVRRHGHPAGSACVTIRNSVPTTSSATETVNETLGMRPVSAYTILPMTMV